jgi:SAM-dependent methyltransferase
LLSHASGKVLEIGVGTGQNLSLYPPSARVTGIEPEPIHKEVSMTGTAEALPFADNEFDAVVSTLVFCSIPKFEQAFHETKRVLKPGGKLLLIEHVRLNGVAGKIQDALTPMWSCVVDGCHLNRQLDDLVLGAGFDVLEKRVLWNGLGRYWVLAKSDSNS